MNGEIREKIAQAIGEASTCWTNLDGAGEFDAERAGRIADELVAFLSEKDAEKVEENYGADLFEARLTFILEPLQRGIPPDQLYKVATSLLQRGGEYKVCGQVLWRAIEHLFGGEGQGDQQRESLGFDTAYGSMTFRKG